MRVYSSFREYSPSSFMLFSYTDRNITLQIPLWEDRGADWTMRIFVLIRRDCNDTVDKGFSCVSLKTHSSCLLWTNQQLVLPTSNLIFIYMDSDPSKNCVLMVTVFMAW